MTRPAAVRSLRSAAPGRLARHTIGLLAISLMATSPVVAQTPSAASPVPAASAAAASSATPTSPAVLALFPDAGFKVALPSDWLAIELAPDPDAAAAAFSADHPELAEALAAMRLSGPLDTFAVAPLTDGDPFPATFASFQGMNMGMTAAQLQRLGVTGLQQLGVTGDIESETLEISGTPAYHLGYAWDLPLPGGDTTPVHVDQFTLVTPETVLVFSLTDDVPLPDHGAAVAASFELLP